MRGAKKRQALPAIVLLLLASAPPPPGAEGRDVPAAGAERGALLDILLQALGDDGRPLPPRPPRRDRVISRRYSGGGAPQTDPRTAAAPRPPPAHAAAPPPPRLLATARHGEIFPRDSSLKDKFIKHFTGPVTFSSECSKHFHRLYHNTRDCSTPTLKFYLGKPIIFPWDLVAQAAAGCFSTMDRASGGGCRSGPRASSGMALGRGYQAYAAGCYCPYGF